MVFSDCILIDQKVTSTLKNCIQTNTNGNIEIEPYKVTGFVDTKEFFQKCLSSELQNGQLLPKNCRFIQTNPDLSYLLVIEDEPQVRPIYVNTDLTSTIEFLKINGKFEEYNLKDFNMRRKPYRFLLSFPYVVYLIYYYVDNKYPTTRLSVFFRLSPLTSLEDYLLLAPFTNINSDTQEVCLGARKFFNSVSFTTNELISTFWNNYFNNDYSQNKMEYEQSSPELCDYFTWQHYSKIDPLFIFSATFKPHNKNLLQSLKFMDKNFNKPLSISKYIDFIDTESIRKKEIEEKRSMAESIVINNQIIYIGNKVILDNEEYFISSFNKEDGEIFSINLTDNKNNIKEIPILSPEFQNKILNSLKEPIIESIVINNRKIKVGDLLKCNISGLVRRLNKIIRFSDKSIHLKIDNDFYLPSALKHFKIIDKFNVDFNGVKLISGKKYHYINVNSEKYNEIFYRSRIGIFHECKVNNNRLYYEFSDFIDGETDSDKFILSEFSFIIIEKPREVQLYRVNELLYNNSQENKLSIVNNIGISASRNYNDNSRRNFKYDKGIWEEYLSSVEDELFIASFDFDIHYKINDEVIYIDWKRREEMKKIKKIIGFKLLKNKNRTIFFLCLQDSSGDIEEIPFITLSDTEGRITAGKIRKVCSELNGIKVGTKVISKVVDIPDFPKKDCNQICAFVIDEKDPLVLYSNYRTTTVEYLLENFDLFEPGTKKYLSHSITPPRLIKIQDRDLVIIDNDKVLACWNYNNFNRYLQCTDINSNSFSSVSNINNEIYLRYGLLLPRHLPQKKTKNCSVIRWVGSRSNILPCSISHFFPNN